uniref:F-box domain-containing protein n=1 Tax=Aegilops tauschii TaxID=37682 RepID=R7W468_AEGTA
MAGGGVDRLSSLPNDLLCRILHFAPLKEAASTTALSRRWREPLWLSSGAVNLETGVVEKKKHRRRPGQGHDHAHARFFSGSDDLVSAATGALDTAVVPVTRLSLISWYSNHYEVVSSYKDMVEVVLSHRAARNVEELLLVAKDPSGNPYNRWEVKIGPPGGGWYFEKTVDRLKIDAMRLRRFSYKGQLRSYSFSPQHLELEQVDLEFFEQDYHREMRLKVNHLKDIAVLSEARQVELLPAFRRLERLEFQGAHWTNDKTAAVTTILNLLHCCPVLTTLQINLTAKSSLRRVDLQFQLEKKDCLGVKLIKSFAENAMVLEEIRIDIGDEKLCEHMNPRIAKWNSSRKVFGATSFVVLPLKM